MSTALYRQVARRIERSIRSDPSRPAPSTLDVCRDHGIAYVTACKVMHELIDRDVLKAVRGRKPVVHPDIRPESAAASLTAASRLALLIRQRINDGTYRIGSRLPKLDYFTITHHSSRPTAIGALSALARDNAIHKVGGRWFAGPAPAQPPHSPLRASYGGNRVVLLLLKDTGEWAAAVQNPFSSRFATPFCSELAVHDMRVLPITRDESEKNTVLAPAAGRAQARRLIRELGSRYAGTLAWSVDPSEEAIDEWIVELAAWKKPVIFFDSADTGAHLTRGALGVGGDYARMHFDENGAIALALGSLAAWGHRTVGLHRWDSPGWAKRRIDRIAARARIMDPPMHVVVSAPAETAWRFDGEAGALFKSISRRAGIPVLDDDGRPNRDLRDHLVRNSSSLADLLRDTNVTALISLYDRMAWDHHNWCRAVGVDIPRNLSLISFDNSEVSVLHPITTIDMGFERLGYLAAHACIGDIPLHAGRNGNIPGACTLVDRGSMAAPGRRTGGRSVLRG